MASEIINSIFFGLGIMVNIVFLIGFKLKKEDIKEIIKDIGGGLLFVFFMFSIALGDNMNEGISYLLYVFYFGFCITFTMSFKKKILLKISEINLLVINVIFLYFCVTRLGFDNYFTKIIYIPTIIVFGLVLFKNELKNVHKGLLYTWYILLFMIFSIISIYQISADSYSIYSSYLSSFFKGGIFLYVLIYFYCLLVFIKIIDFFLSKNRHDVYLGRMELKEHFSDLANSFNRTKINNFKILILFILLLGFLIINYYYNYISEGLLIVFILFIASVSSAKRVDLTKKDIERGK
ncbi:hypothetical protein GQ568_00615 [Patescibacteria group bacterium]|nr:hypothetical protein [Patescibacteria group bacterium]